MRRGPLFACRLLFFTLLFGRSRGHIIKTGIFADIHANREALEACLSDSKLHGVDQYVFLGDLVGYGADPVWVLETVMQYHKSGALVVLGNHDSAVLLKKPDGKMRNDAQIVIDWTRSLISIEHLQFLKTLPFSVIKNDILFLHANAWAPAEWDYVLDAADAKKSLTATYCRLTFIGHIHRQVLYHQGVTGSLGSFIPVSGVDIPLSVYRRWLAVIGSVGQPRDGNPSASYAVYDSERRMLTYYRVPFNFEATIAKIHDAGLPDWLGTRLKMGV